MVKTLITNKVTAIFTMTLGKPIAYAMHALPTAVSRLKALENSGTILFHATNPNYSSILKGSLNFETGGFQGGNNSGVSLTQ
jgi:hypothetical protein